MQVTEAEQLEELKKKFELLSTVFVGLLYCQETDLKRKVRKTVFEMGLQNGLKRFKKKSKVDAAGACENDRVPRATNLQHRVGRCANSAEIYQAAFEGTFGAGR